MVAALTIVPSHLSRIRSADPNRINLIPLGYSFKCYRTARDEDPRLTVFCLRNTFGNIALLLPFGLLLPLISDRFGSFSRVLLTAVCLSVTIETIQFFSQFIGNSRSVDIDDVLLNSLGACLGFLVYRLIRNQHNKMNPQISPITRI